MIVHIRAFANFRDILGKDLNVEVKEGSTVKDLLDQLILSRQRLKSAIFDESGKVREYVILMKNRKNIDNLAVWTLSCPRVTKWPYFLQSLEDRSAGQSSPSGQPFNFLSQH